MDIISIQCPHCGAGVERKQNEYFGVCPYCGSEVCFDDIKTEAEVIGLRNKVSDLDKRLNDEKIYKQQLAHWKKTRDKVYIITCIMSFFGFLCAILSDDSEGNLIAIGVTLLLISVFTLLIYSPLKCAGHPAFDVKNKNFGENISKAGMLFKFLGVGFLLICGTAFCSAIIYAIIE